MAGKKKHVLHVKPRSQTGSAASRRARREGTIPSVLYGHGAAPRNFLLDSKEWLAIAKQEIQIVVLEDTKDGQKTNALIKEIQFDYLSGQYRHIDFLEVKMDETIHATVPVHHIGVPAGLSQGGVMEQPLHEVEVECTPLTLPEHIEVDVSPMQLNDLMTVANLPYPEGVKPVSDLDQLVFHVMTPRAEEEAPEEEEEAILEEGVAEEEAKEEAKEE